MKESFKVSRRNWSAALPLLVLCSSIVLPAERSAEEILAAVDGIRAPGPSFAFDLKIDWRPAGKESVIQKMSVSVKDLKKSLVRFTDPPENRGRLLLMVGQDLWIHIPSSNQAIRIAPQQRLLGQVANGDVARVIYSYDYKASLAGTDIFGQTSCKVLELSAKTAEATYGKIRMWVDAQNDRPLKAEYYTSTGKLLKTGLYEDYQRILGKDRPMRITIADAVRKGDMTALELSRMRIADLPDSDFSKDTFKYAH
jgi:outer membrane lipoprotein-sorting protein